MYTQRDMIPVVSILHNDESTFVEIFYYHMTRSFNRDSSLELRYVSKVNRATCAIIKPQTR